MKFLNFVKPYVVVTVIVIIAFGLKFLTPHNILHEIPFLIFFSAVVISGIYGGFKVGIYATILSGTLVYYFLLAPTGTFFKNDWHQVFKIVLYFLECATIAALCSSLKKSLEMTKRLQKSEAEARLKLQSSEARLKLAIESAQMGTWHIDLETNIVSTSEGAATILAVSINNQNILGLIARLLHPEDQDRVIRVWEEAVEKQAAYYDEYRIIRPDGAFRWLFSKGTTELDSNGNAKAFAGVIGDITARKEAEKAHASERDKLQAIFQESPAAMALWRGPRLIFEKLNPKFQDIFESRILIGKPLLEAIPELAGQHLHDLILKVFETGESFIGHEILFNFERLNGFPGVNRYYNFAYIRINDSEGKPYGVYNHTIDVTDGVLSREALVNNKNQLQITVSELEQEREQRERFVAALSHDLRTPLTAAKASAHIIHRSTHDPEKLQKLAGRINNNMDRAEQMIRDLLDVSRINAGENIILNIGECDLNEIIKVTIEDLSSIHGERLVLNATEHFIGFWDCKAIRRIVENLVNNALKYGSKTGIITISLNKSESFIKIAVHNEGNPIPIEDQAKLFEPYRRLVSATKSSQGWGLGLTLVRGFAEAHGGKAYVQSSLNEGTTFSICIPQDSSIHWDSLK